MSCPLLFADTIALFLLAASRNAWGILARMSLVGLRTISDGALARATLMWARAGLDDAAGRVAEQVTLSKLAADLGIVFSALRKISGAVEG